MEWLAAMASLGERVAHALAARGKKAAHLDAYLAERFGKLGTGAGYTHRVLKKGLQPGPEQLAAIADYLNVSLEWLIRGGPINMDRKATEAPPTYESLTGWAEAAAREIERGRVAPYVIGAVGRSPIFIRPTEVTPDFVLRAAVFWLQEAPDDERAAAVEAEARRIKAEEDAKRRH